jgi:3-dehydroquinate dehydratase II
MTMNILLLNGPNLNLTGLREPTIYGTTTLAEIEERVRHRAAEGSHIVRAVQSNHEGVLIDTLHGAKGWAHGALLNAGALTHYSYALRDAIAAIEYPVVEVHMSLPVAREPFRHVSVIAPVCRGHVAGFGAYSYIAALDSLLHMLETAL